MRDILLLVSVAALFALGWSVMGRLDAATDRNHAVPDSVSRRRSFRRRTPRRIGHGGNTPQNMLQ